MYGKNLRITRILKDPSDGTDIYFKLGCAPEVEFKFAFVIHDEILNIVILAFSVAIVITYPTSHNYYDPSQYRVVVDDCLYDGFYTALEKIRKGEIQETYVKSIRPISIELIKISITKKDRVRIHYDPYAKSKRDQVEIDQNNLDRFLAILRKVKSLPFVEKVRLEELVEFKYGIDDE